MAVQFRKSGGGYLHGVAATIVAAAFESKTWPGKKGKDDYTTLTVRIDVKQDGADGAVPQFIPAGFLYDNQVISEDGLEVSSDDDRAIIGEDSEYAALLQSAFAAGLSEEPFEPHGNTLNGLVNQRFVFKKERNTELMDQLKAQGKNPKQKGSDGKEYDRQLLLIGEYLGEAEAPKKGAKATKTTAKATTGTKTSVEAKGGKTNGAAKVAEVDALVEQAEAVLLDILAAAGDAVNRTGLSSKIVKHSTENRFSDDAKEHNEIRENLRKLIGSEDFLNRENGWSYDAKAKGQPVSL